jgi:hypothetical protein
MRLLEMMDVFIYIDMGLISQDVHMFKFIKVYTVNIYSFFNKNNRVVRNKKSNAF